MIKNKPVNNNADLEIAHRIMLSQKMEIKQLKMELGRLEADTKRAEIREKSLLTEIKSLRNKVHMLEQGHQIATPKCDYFGRNGAYEMARLTTENQFLRQKIKELEIGKGHNP